MASLWVFFLPHVLRGRVNRNTGKNPKAPHDENDTVKIRRGHEGGVEGCSLRTEEKRDVRPALSTEA